MYIILKYTSVDTQPQTIREIKLRGDGKNSETVCKLETF